MARRYTLKSFNVGGDKQDLADAVGKLLDVKRLTRTSSRQYGDGMEILANLVDMETGEQLLADARYVTFSGPVVRDLGQILGDTDTWDLGGDVLSLVVRMAGQAYVLEDAPIKEGETVMTATELAVKDEQPFGDVVEKAGNPNPPSEVPTEPGVAPAS